MKLLILHRVMILWLAITANMPLIWSAPPSLPSSRNQSGDDANGFPGAIGAVPPCPIPKFLLPTPPVSDAMLPRAQSKKPAMGWNDWIYGEGYWERDIRNRQSVGRRRVSYPYATIGWIQRYCSKESVEKTPSSKMLMRTVFLARIAAELGSKRYPRGRGSTDRGAA